MKRVRAVLAAHVAQGPHAACYAMEREVMAIVNRAEDKAPGDPGVWYGIRAAAKWLTAEAAVTIRQVRQDEISRLTIETARVTNVRVASTGR